MGRIKTKLIKAKTNEVMEHHSEKVTTKFNDNKKVLADVATIHSKKMRNAIAGYLVRLKKNERD